MNNVEELDKAMQVMSESAGSVDAEMNIVMDTYEKRVAQLKNAWQEALNATTSSETIKNIVGALTNLCGVLQKVGGLAPVLAGIGATLSVAGILSLVGAIGRVTKAFTEARLAGLSFKSILMSFSSCAGTIGMLVGAVTTLGVALVNASRQTEEASRQAIAKAGEEARAYANNTKEVENYAQSYKQIIKNTSDTTQKKAELSELQDILVEQFGQEAKEIDLLTGNYDENIRKIRELVEAKGEMAKVDLEDEIQAEQEAIDNMFKNGVRDVGKSGLSQIGISYNDIEEFDKVFEKIDGLKAKWVNKLFTKIYKYL